MAFCNIFLRRAVLVCCQSCKISSEVFPNPLLERPVSKQSKGLSSVVSGLYVLDCFATDIVIEGSEWLFAIFFQDKLCWFVAKAADGFAQRKIQHLTLSAGFKVVKVKLGIS